MSPAGIVVDIDKNIATVKLVEFDECEGCEFSRFCSVGKGEKKIICKNNKGANVGDLVEVDTSRRNLLLAGLINFIFPLLLLVIGVLLGAKIWKSELLGFLLAISFIILYFLLFRFIDRAIIKSGKIIPEIINIKRQGE